MENKMTLEDLLKLHDFETVEELSEYIGYLEDVKADYEYIKSRFRYFVNEMDKLY